MRWACVLSHVDIRKAVQGNEEHQAVAYPTIVAVGNGTLQRSGPNRDHFLDDEPGHALRTFFGIHGEVRLRLLELIPRRIELRLVGRVQEHSLFRIVNPHGSRQVAVHLSVLQMYEQEPSENAGKYDEAHPELRVLH